MSLFVLQPEDWLKKFQPPTSLQHEPHSIYLTSINEAINAQLYRHNSLNVCSILDDKHTRRYYFLFEYAESSYKGVLRLNYDKRRENWAVVIDLLSPSGFFLKMENRALFIQVAKNLVFHGSYNKFVGKVLLHPLNNQLRLKFPLFLHTYSSSFELLSSSRREGIFKLLSRQFCQTYLPYIEGVLKSTLPLQRRFQPFKHEKITPPMIFKYMDMLLLSSNLRDGVVETEAEIRQRQIVLVEETKRLCKNKLAFQNEVFGSLKLFSTAEKAAQRIPKDYQLMGQEMVTVKALILMPPSVKNNNLAESNSILKHVLLHEPQSKNFMKINEGGFSNIIYSFIRFWEVNSSEGKSYDPSKSGTTLDKLIERQVAIKVQPQNVSYSRNAHQIQILKNIKNGSSVFLPRYYVAVNNIPPYRNSVIMDFIKFPTLEEYTHFNACSLSLISKVHLFFAMVLGLRYLQDYRIVHLDLKPNNIMIFRHLLVKFIDFGQSYHPNVHSKAFPPGFTLPYSSPEIFQKDAAYTFKSDIYSLGIIMFQMLYGRHPFRIYKSGLRVEMSRYLDYWFCAPQQLQNQGDPFVLRILNCIISKCLDLNPQKRPQLDRLAVVFRICLDIIC